MAAKEASIPLAAQGSLPQKDVTVAEFQDFDALSSSLAAYVFNAAERAVARKGSFSIALSGGSLVKALGALAREPVARSTNWSKWWVVWADERMVPLDHPDSNYLAAKKDLLSKVPIPVDQILAINPALPSAVEAAADYEARIRELTREGRPFEEAAGFPSIDMVLLGIGPDGHVASLFPHHPLLEERHAWVAPILDSPKPPPQRITLTLPVLNAAGQVVVVAAGGSKADVICAALQSDAPLVSLPVQMVRPVTGPLIWMLDSVAAQKLDFDKGLWSAPTLFV